jgi:hypothetical protein
VPLVLPIVLTFTAVTALQSVAARADDAGSDAASDASGPGEGGSDAAIDAAAIDAAAVDAVALIDAGSDGDSGDAAFPTTPASCEAQGGKWQGSTGCGGSMCVLPDGRRIQGTYPGMNVGAGCC